MKKVILLAYSLALSFVFSPIAHADLSQDRASIAAMKGCYEVNFHFAETGTTDPNYPIRSNEFNDHGLEWVELDQNSEQQVHLQHILITPNGPLKHWRQEWEFQPSVALSFLGNFTWNTLNLSTAEVEGKWIQRVYSVDDSPRYECVAAWSVNEKGQNSWKCTTYAPLPRREFTQRSDYNVLDRTNDHVITSDGWLHVQDNRKINLTASGATQIATEKGLDTYRRVDDSRCVEAQKFWTENKSVWHGIEDMWKHIRGHHPSFRLLSKVEGKLLWENLFALAELTAQEVSTTGVFDVEALRKKTHDLIHQYMVVNE